MYDRIILLGLCFLVPQTLFLYSQSVENNFEFLLKQDDCREYHDIGSKIKDDLQCNLDHDYKVYESSLLALHSLYNETDSIHYFQEALRLLELTKHERLSKWAPLNQFLLKEQQTLLYFLSGEKYLFLLALSPNGAIFNKTFVGRDSLETLVQRIRQETLTSPTFSSSNEMDELKLLSQRLYEITIAPVDSICTNRLLIIPDGSLTAFPLASLLSKIPNANMPIKEWPFAIKQFSFSYAYALDLLLNPSNKGSLLLEKKILAFAPDFNSSRLKGTAIRQNGPLHNNKEEVKHIKDQFSTEAFLGEEARLDVFRKYASDYSVVHLATHAVVNTESGDYSYLVFSEKDIGDCQLSAREVYMMDIPADLVVLSACETGLGEWQKTGGIINLERAFSHAGAQSLVSTHWKVSDRASASLMNNFYDALAMNLPKDQALQQAQLKFISENDSWLVHPFFWAAYVQKGNTQPLDIPKNVFGWKWCLTVFGVVFGLLFLHLRILISP